MYSGQKHRSQHSSKAAAKAWEIAKKTELENLSEDLVTLTVSLLDWSTLYLDHAEVRFVAKTYKEKHLAFRQLFKAVNPDMEVFLLHKGLVLAHFREQARIRSGYAANKDRKNLVAAWNWGVQLTIHHFS